MAEKVAPAKLRPRISLATLLCFVFCLASAALVVLHWEPWVLDRTIQVKASEFKFKWNIAHFSDDGLECWAGYTLNSGPDPGGLGTGFTQEERRGFQPKRFSTTDGRALDDGEKIPAWVTKQGYHKASPNPFGTPEILNPLTGENIVKHLSENLAVARTPAGDYALSPDGHHGIVQNVITNETELISLDTYALERVLNNIITSMPSAEFSANSSYVAISGITKEVEGKVFTAMMLFTIKDKKALSGFVTSAEPRAIFAPDEKIVFTSVTNPGDHSGDALNALEVDTGRVIRKWSGKSEYDVVFSPDGTRVAVTWLDTYPVDPANPKPRNRYNVEVLEYPGLKSINTFTSLRRVDRFVGNRDFVASTIEGFDPSSEVLSSSAGNSCAILSQSSLPIYSADGNTYWEFSPLNREAGLFIEKRNSYNGRSIWWQELEHSSGLLKPHVSKDDNTLLLVFANGELQQWVRRRLEAWWGIFYRYECWLALLTLTLLLISFYRDVKNRKLYAAR